MQITFLNSPDGTRLRALKWGAGARDVLVVHGLAEHAGRYSHVAEALAARGWTVTVLELRGHGHSGGRRGYVERWDDYVGDVRAAVASLREGWSLIGHSMGGLVALEAVRLGLCPAKLAVSNPLLGVRIQAPPMKIFAARGLSRVWPTLSLANEIDSKLLSRDPVVGKAYDADPLVYSTVTPRWYTEMIAAQERVSAMPPPSVPLGFFVSDGDQICDPPKALALGQRLSAMIKEYPEMYHEIFNEIGKEKVIADVADWLEAG